MIAVGVIQGVGAVILGSSALALVWMRGATARARELEDRVRRLEGDDE